jgi:cell division protein FtsQ
MAPKSGPSILQEELYPSGTERARVDFAREEIGNARLVDLDMDGESPFLRAQKRVSARRSSLPQKTANRLLWGCAAAAALCAVGLVATWLYHYGEHSWRFRIESSDNIEITGIENVTKTQITEVMGAAIGRNIFFIPLAQQQAQLEQIPWVESASVMRFVPNRLAVQIHERTPVAFARVGQHIFLIDGGGTLMELSTKHKYSFPVILGMNPGEPISTRAPRMKAYTAMLRQLDSGGAHYSQDLSEVDLSDLEDVKVRVNDSAGDVLVHLGSSDFLQRYQTFVSHARAWRQQFQKLESVDLRYDNQIIVNPDMERPSPVMPKTGPLRAAAAKKTTALKPAALLTRVGPHQRALPKPAFELTEKKTDAKAAAGRLGAKKAARPHTTNVAGLPGKRPAAGAAVKRAVPKQNLATTRRLNASAIPPKTTAMGKPSSTATANVTPKFSGGQKPSAGIVKTQTSTASTD